MSPKDAASLPKSLDFESPPEVKEVSEAGKIARHKALGNPLVLKKILDCLDFPSDLKQVRLVGPSWNSFSCEILLQRNSLQVLLKFDPVTRRFYASRQINTDPKSNESDTFSPLHSLQDLNKILAKSSQFPSTSFYFSGGSLVRPEFGSFLQIQGSLIKTLELYSAWRDYSCPEVEDEVFNGSQMPTLANTFRRSLPNLESLTLTDTDFDYSENYEDLVAKWSLDKLRFFQFNRGHSLAMKVLQGAPNLKIIKVVQNSDLILFTQKSSFDLIQELHCNFRDPGKILMDFATFEQRNLRKICIKSVAPSYYGERNKELLLQALSTLLESSAGSLESLQLGNLVAISGMKSLPRFPKLKTFQIGPPGYFHKLCLPPGTNVNDKFPAVVTLDCRTLKCSQDKNWDAHFPPPCPFIGNFDRVRTLKIRDNFTDQWMQKLKELCPNFDRLDLTASSRLENALTSVFKYWSHLKDLKILMTTAAEEETDFDVVFTGTSRTGGEEPYKGRSRILDMKELRKLRLAFLTPFPVDCQSLTPFSWVNAFKMMPRLQVTLEYDHNQLPGGFLFFESIRPFVNIVHRRIPAEEFGM